MRIHSPHVQKHRKQVTYSARIESFTGPTHLWYTLSDKYADLVTGTCDPAIVGLILPAMAAGEDVHVAGPVSERLFYNLSSQFQHLAQSLFPWLQRVKLDAETLHSGFDNRSGVATGFSGGIDSFSVLADHYYSSCPENFQITHLLFNNVGSHGAGGEKLFEERYAQLAPLVEELGLPFLKINSNMAAFYQKSLTFRRTHTLRNASAALVLGKGIACYLYASGFAYRYMSVKYSQDTCRPHPMVLCLLSTESMDMICVGCEYTRVQKTMQVAELSDSYEYLDVCVRPDNAQQCSTCWKCLRTLLTLDIGGVLERYATLFDLEAYREKRDRYLGYVLQSSDPLVREVADFAEKRDFRIPWSARCYAKTYSLYASLRELLDPPEHWRKASSFLRKVAKSSIR